VLAGFYEERLSFAFPAAFRKEARLRVAAEFRPEDTAAVLALVETGAFSLDGLITHRSDAAGASGRLPDRLRRPRLPQDDPGLESLRMSVTLLTHRSLRAEAAVEPDPVPHGRGHQDHADHRHLRQRAAAASPSPSPTSAT
jgi:hypothetical protein